MLLFSMLINAPDIEDSKFWTSRSTFLRYRAASISKFQTSISMFLRYRTASISKFHASISKILRYRTGSISYVTTFDIDVYQILSIRYPISKDSMSSCHIVPDIKGHFQPLISKVGPSISLYNDIEGLTFDIEDRQGSRC